jgi:hypothetical protein
MQIAPKPKIVSFLRGRHAPRWAVLNSVIQTNAQLNARREYLGASVQIVLNAKEGVLRMGFTQKTIMGIAPTIATNKSRDAEYAGG